MTCFRFLVVPALLVFVQPLGVVASDDATDKMRPVAKVITLLKDMLKQLEVEKEKDKEIYENMVCWCKKNDKVKTKSIADAEARIADLKNMIEQYVARIAQLKIEVEDLETEIEKNRKALAKAKAMREKQIAEFNDEEAELILTIQTVTAGAQALEEHNSFLQLSSSTLRAVVGKVQEVMQKHDGLLKSKFTPSERKAFSSFVQFANHETVKSKDSYHPEYAPQSGEVFGMLEQMKETFQQNLDKLQEDEKVAQKTYEGLKAAKEDQIATALSEVETKERIIAETQQKLAQAQEELADLEKTLEEDTDFLAKLKEKCALSDKEYEARTISRNDEMTAVTEALTILSGDDAQDTFARTYNAASFLQLASAQQSTQSMQRAQVVKILSRVAERSRNPKLSNLVVRARLDAFTEVKKNIDEMVKQLLKQKADEITKRESCINMINENELATGAKQREKTDLESRIAVLESEIKDLEDEIKALKSTVDGLMVELKVASENRDKESKEFQATLADQHATVKLLQAAQKVLAKFYGKAEAASAVGRDAGEALLQKSVGGQAPPELYENKALEKRDAGVMRLIAIIIKDAETMTVESKKAESDMAATYEAFAQETKKSVDANLATIANKAAVKATKEADLIETEKDLGSTETDISNLASENRDLHGECDYTIKNFAIRQQARDEEVEALNEAKAILSGADFTNYYYKN